nr:MAG TPA: hypothetical protein [Caudoviricetes sp.]
MQDWQIIIFCKSNATIYQQLPVLEWHRFYRRDLSLPS